MPGWDGDMVRGFGTILSPLRICEGLKMRLSEDNRDPPSLTGINETETDSAGSNTICPQQGHARGDVSAFFGHDSLLAYCGVLRFSSVCNTN